MSNKYLALQKDVFDISKVTVVGSLAITDDGVASNYSQGNYVQIAQNPFTSPFKISLEWTTGDTISNSNYAWQGDALLSLNKGNNGFVVGQRKGRLELRNAKTGVTDGVVIIADGLYGRENVFTTNTKYLIVMEFTGSRYNFFVNDELIYTFESELYPAMTNKTITIGSYGSNNSVTNGSIDLKQFKIYVDGQLVFKPVKPTYLLERRKPMVWNKGQFTIVGSPVITDDGVATYITGQNYVYIPPIDYTKPFAIKKIGFTQASIGSNFYFINGARVAKDFGGFVIGFNGSNRKLRMFLSSTGTSWDIASAWESSTILELNKPYYVDLIYNGTNYVFILYDFSLKELERVTVNKSTPIYNSQQGIMMGANFISSTVYNGKIFLNKFVVENDGAVVFDGSKQTYIYNPSKFTIVGSPTITEYGVASGFSSGNYLKANYSFDVTNAKTWEINCVAKATEITRNGFTFLEIYNGATECVCIALRNDSTNNYIYFALKDSGSNGEYLYHGDYLRNYGVVSVNVNYFFKLRFTGSEYLLSVSTDGKNYTVIKQISNSTSLGNGKDIFLGLRKLNNVTDQGSIDLTQFSITVDGKEVFTGAKENFYMLRR